MKALVIGGNPAGMSAASRMKKKAMRYHTEHVVCHIMLQA